MLRCLRLDNNKISVIPLQICNMSKLYELRLEQNQITILPLEVLSLLAFTGTKVQILTPRRISRWATWLSSRCSAST
jgi:Leucine-rich repeat (LRR) protein